MPLLFVLVILALLGVVAVLAAGRLGSEGAGMPEPVVDRAPLGLPDGPMSAAALSELRLSVGFRGYRMDQVDEVLDRCARELAARDTRIAALERQLEHVPVVATASAERSLSTGSAPTDYKPTDSTPTDSTPTDTTHQA